MTKKKARLKITAAKTASLPPIKSDADFIGRLCYERTPGNDAGTITGVSRRGMEGCRGLRLHVKWPGGRRTYPCSRGCVYLDGGHVRIR